MNYTRKEIQNTDANGTPYNLEQMPILTAFSDNVRRGNYYEVVEQANDKKRGVEIPPEAFTDKDGIQSVAFPGEQLIERNSRGEIVATDYIPNCPVTTAKFGFIADNERLRTNSYDESNQ